jgi:hypothetical protein
VSCGSYNDKAAATKSQVTAIMEKWGTRTPVLRHWFLRQVPLGGTDAGRLRAAENPDSAGLSTVARTCGSIGCARTGAVQSIMGTDAWQVRAAPASSPYGLSCPKTLPGLLGPPYPTSRAATPRAPATDGAGALFDGETQTRTGDTTIFSHPSRAAGYRAYVAVLAPITRACAPATSSATWSLAVARSGTASIVVCAPG